MKKSYWDILDEMASGEEYINLGDVVKEYYRDKDIAPSNTSEYNTIRQWLNRNKEHVDCQNGSSLDGGFRYEVGYEYMHRMNEEEKKLKRMNSDARWLLRTGGLPNLFEGQTPLDHLVELEFVPKQNDLTVVKEISKHLNKDVVEFSYHQGYKNLMEIKMHPHLLKEYNSRWFLFGYIIEDSGYQKVVCFAVDRIVSESFRKSQSHDSIQKASMHFYQDYFKDIVGVTKPDNGVLETITFRSTSFLVHHLLKTKPIHPSQVEKKEFDETTQTGEFTITVIPNIELRTRFLSYGAGVYVVGEGWVQDQIRETLKKMHKLY